MQRNLKYRILLAAFLLVAAFTVVSSHLVTIQGVEHEKWIGRAEADYTRRIELPAYRGNIYDRNMEQLAHNRPVYDLVADYYALSDLNTVVKGVAKARGVKEIVVTRDIGGRKAENLRKIQPEYYDYLARVLVDHLPGEVAEMRAHFDFGKRKRVVLAENLSMEDMVAMKNDFNARQANGLIFEEKMERYYPNGSSLCHVLGFVDRANIGREGVEAQMEQRLAGKPGFREMMVDRKGRQIPSYRSRETPPSHGGNVKLTIHTGLQGIVEEELVRAEEEFLFSRAAVVLMDPATGDILALANRPIFDPNTREGERRNFAFSDVYEPGSTFKVVAALAALDLGLVQPETQIFCNNGTFNEGGVTIHDHHPYGWLSVSGVMAKSSNVGAYKLARQVGMDRYYDYVAKLGFGKLTGLGLPAESAGVVRATRNPVDFSRCAYGYAVSVTPVQLATAYCAIANGGMLMRPRIVQNVLDNSGNILWDNPPEIRHRVASSRACSQTIRGMKEVVDEKGTGKLAVVPGYSVAGKTGTAHLYNPQTRSYDKLRPVVSFAGFLPAENPKLVCVVVCSEPRTEKVTRYGGTIAAPVFSRIATRAMDLMGIPPDMPVPEGPKSASNP